MNLCFWFGDITVDNAANKKIPCEGFCLGAEKHGQRGAVEVFQPTLSLLVNHSREVQGPVLVSSETD